MLINAVLLFLYDECSHVFPQSSDPQGQCLAAPQATNYKQRLDEFKKLFKELPENDRLIVGQFYFNT